jgi:excisionase family DNA binding protein
LKLLTVREVAEAMRVSEKTVRRLIKRGDLTAYKVGDRGQLRVKEIEMVRYLEAQRVEVQVTDEELAESGE